MAESRGRLSVVVYRNVSGKSADFLRTWDFSIHADSKHALRFAELASLIFGTRLNGKGALEHIPQPPVAEIRQRFALEISADREVGKLAKWLLNPRSNRSPTPATVR